jgi:hypothetical protein
MAVEATGLLILAYVITLEELTHASAAIVLQCKESQGMFVLRLPGCVLGQQDEFERGEVLSSRLSVTTHASSGAVEASGFPDVWNIRLPRRRSHSTERKQAAKDKPELAMNNHDLGKSHFVPGV